MLDRKGIIIYFRNKKAIKAIKKCHINISYVNEKGRYITGYCNETDYEGIKKDLKRNRLIKRVEESLIELPEINL